VTAPFFCGDFPDFGGKASADVVLFFDAYDPHAAPFGDSPRPMVGYGFWHTEHRETEIVEPEIGDRGHGFGHQAPALPRHTEPEAAVVGGVVEQTDGSDDLLRSGPETECPVPLFAALHGRKSDVAVVGESTVGGIRPGNMAGEKLDDSPMRKDTLDLLCVCQFKRTQQKAPGLELRSHGSIVASFLKGNGDPKVSVASVVRLLKSYGFFGAAGVVGRGADGRGFGADGGGAATPEVAL